MTQTQDEQNAQNPVVQAADSNVATPDVQPAEAQAMASDDDSTIQQQQPEQAPVQPSFEISSSILEDGKNTVTNIANTGVESIKGAGEAGVQSIQAATQQGVESVKDTVAFAGDTLKQTSESAISGISGLGSDLKDGLSQTFQNVTSGGGVLESGTAVVQGTMGTATNVVGNAATSVVNTGQSVVNGTMDAATNIATGATNVVKDGFNNVVGSVIPGQAGQAVTNVTDKVTQSAQDLGNKAKETLQETGEKAKGFFTGIWDNFKSGFSTKDAQNIMNEADSPLNVTSDSDVVEPAAPQVPAPEIQQPAAPQAPAAEVQPGDIQQPTPNQAA